MKVSDNNKKECGHFCRVTMKGSDSNKKEGGHFLGGYNESK